MGFKCLIAALALVACLCVTGLGQGPKNVINVAEFPDDYLSGSQIREEVGWGVYDDLNDSSLSFRNESLFIIRRDTGMSPNVPGQGVRTPAVIGMAGAAIVSGSWALTLNDLDKSYLKLDLYQSLDAVFGSGELAKDGMTTAVSAGGSILGDRLALFVVPAGSQSMYRFSLTVQQGSMNGEYLFTAPGVNQPGLAYGSMISPQAAPIAMQPLPSTLASPANQSQLAAIPPAMPVA